MDKIKKIKELVLKLNIYRNEYYNKNNPTISDYKYDMLYDELYKLEFQTGFILSNSPTRNVGYKVVSKLQKVNHNIPLLSLNKTKDINDIKKFSQNKELIAMHKLDGLTTELEYNNGELISASTRGDGYQGELITHNISAYKNVPMKINNKNHIRISGESVIHKNDFDKINSKLSEDKKYKTPRNLVSGSVRQLNSEICSKREVYFYAYNILGFNDQVYLHNRGTKRLDFVMLQELGFQVVDWMYVNSDQFNFNCKTAIKLLQKSAEDKYIPIDGIVFTFNDMKFGESLGYTEHHPLHSIAYKFYDKPEETVLRDVEWSMGRTGVLTPVAVFDTVQIDSTDVSRASLHNISIVKGLKLGIGDKISVIKSNQIIPQITENLTKSNSLVIPDSCPICNGKTKIKQDNDSEVLICTNPYCSGKLLSKLVHFCSKPCMNIEGLSEASIKKFIDNGWLNNFLDVYKLYQHKDKIIKMDSFGKKSYDNLWLSIQNSKNVKLENFITALSIPNIGKTASKVISNHFHGDWVEFENAMFNNFNFTKLTDFGQTMNDSIYYWYNNFYKRYVADWEILIELLNFVKPIKEFNDNTIFSNKKIYCTGSFASYKKDQLKSIIESMGGIFTSGYAKSLDYLIVGNLKRSSKVEKAKKDNIYVMTEDEFLSNIQNIN